MSFLNEPEYFDIDEEEEEYDDFKWFDLDEMLAAERGQEDFFDPEGWTGYWTHEVWEHFDKNKISIEEDEAEPPDVKELNDNLFIECNIKMVEQGVLGSENQEILRIHQMRLFL